MKVLFIKTKDLKANTIIDGNVDIDLFMQYIKIAQDIHLQNYLGTKLYERLEAGILAGDLNADESKLLTDYVQDALIHFAMAEYLPFAAVKVKNGGVFKYSPENTNFVDDGELKFLIQKERDIAEYYTKRMVTYLCDNTDKYPEYSEDGDVNPDKEVNYTGGWYLGDTE